MHAASRVKRNKRPQYIEVIAFGSVVQDDEYSHPFLLEWTLKYLYEEHDDVAGGSDRYLSQTF